jgi:catechol 2,3-dioxygenase-like lactoylglutathione lyase family enzyme
LDNPTFTEVRVAGAIFGLSEQKGGWTAPDAEFPHYAFEVEGKDLAALKARLEVHGVKTHPIWTRHGVEALMYFRDPSGNLFELYCTQGFEGADQLPRPPGWGGDFRPPIGELSYDWQG